MTDITGTHGEWHGDLFHSYGRNGSETTHHALDDLAEQAANEIMASLQGLDEAHARRFFEWLDMYFDELHFDSKDAPPEFRLQAWLRSYSWSAPVFMLKYQVILHQIETLQRSEK